MFKTVEEIFFSALYIFLKPGILFNARSHKSSSLRPKIFVTRAPVMRITRITKTIPEPGIVVSRLRRDSGRSLAGTRLFTISKKNLIRSTLRASGIQNKSPDIK